jgi:cell division protein FtsX
VKLINPIEHLIDLFNFFPWQIILVKHFLCCSIIFILWTVLFQSVTMGIVGAIAAIIVVHLIFYVIDCL